MSAIQNNGARQDAGGEFDPVSDTIDTIVTLHQRAERRVGLHQRAVETGTALVGRPIVLYLVIVFDILWISLNAYAHFVHHKSFDPPPFYWLQGTTTIGALLIALIVLITQNRQGRLNERRAQLELQISLLNEQKVTKVILLLEELRRDLPSVHNRHDPEAERLTQAIDAHAVADALEERMEADEESVEADLKSGRASQ